MTTEPKAVVPTETPSPLSGPEKLERAMTGFQAYEQGRYTDARDVFLDLVERDPTEGYYRTALGAISLAMDDLDSALEHLDAALRLNSQDTAALVNRGEVHLRLGNIMTGARDFALAVAMDPENKDPLTERARLLAAAALQSAEEAQLVDAEGSEEG
ncbi:tetratricopeptide repeat protein [Archangium sp.]|uniref:tetratricopeptide repeat protein n=1 Tax=Archangium sp. TaxID=1872627 RepID=UPI00286A1455|nr:tetratricopeptide repeat protein [Archangium sp.]